MESVECDTTEKNPSFFQTQLQLKYKHSVALCLLISEKRKKVKWSNSLLTCGANLIVGSTETFLEQGTRFEAELAVEYTIKQELSGNTLVSK